MGLPIAARAGGDSEEGGGAPGSADAPQNFFRDEYASSVEPSSGAFTTRIPIEVPPFHGLEPKLALQYSSSGPNGFVGVGWALGGVSYIDRVSPGNGAPRFDSSDVYSIDGQEMVRCTAMGGNWCPRVQSFERVQKTSSGWEITAKNGIVRTYTSIGSESVGTFRWALTSVKDRHTANNEVSYDYQCNSSSGCYPTTITYNGTTITFTREGRADDVAFSTGKSRWLLTQRLKQIDVSVSGQLVRRYVLVYEVADNASRSLLNRVELRGSDGTTKRPDVVLTYEDGNGGGFASPVSYTPGGTSAMLTGELLTGDFNGDARSDVFYVSHEGANFVQVWLGEEGGSFDKIQLSPPSGVQVRYGYWFTGDVNADGWTDLIHAEGAGPGSRLFVWESDGDGTFTQHEIDRPTNYYPRVDQGRWLAADFDGDGEAELFHAATADSKLHVWDRTADFDFAVTDITPGYTGIHRGYWSPADLNGDGKVDLVHASFVGEQRLNVFLANGASTFFTASSLARPSDYPDFRYGRWNAGDFDGDGRTDLLHASPNSGPGPHEMHIWYSEGGASFERVEIDPPGSGTYFFDGWWFPIDMNGDGRSDLVHVPNPGGTTFNRWISTGAPGEFDLAASPSGGSGYPQVDVGHWQSGDFNGDGRDDLLHVGEDTRARMWLGNGQSGNRMISHRSRIGGVTTIGYTPSSEWQNVKLPVGMLVHTVTSLTRDDREGSPTTFTYEYAGGRWSRQERCFRGFADTRKFDPSGNYEHTLLRQGSRCIHRPSEIHRRGPRPNATVEGPSYSYTTFVYNDVEETTPPFRVLETSRRTFECDTSAQTACQSIRADRTYDGHGNVTELLEHGDTANAQDQRATVTEYSKNTTLYIVDRAKRETVYAAFDASGVPSGKVAQTELYYDLASSIDTAPVRGDLTRVRKWLSPGNTWIAEDYRYDSFGNRNLVIDPRGSQTSTVYDTQYNVYPRTVCNHLNHCSVTEWDGRFGVESSKTDPNGATTSFQYDLFGRLTLETFPDLRFRQTTYLDEATPHLQRVRVREPDPTSDGLWREHYVDGIGREWMVVREGGARQCKTYLEDSTLPKSETLWHADCSTAPTRLFAYYPDDRYRRTIEPSGATTTVTYGDGTAVTTDPLGRTKRRSVDGLGRTTAVREWTSASTFVNTLFSYDTVGNLVGVTDAHGQIATFGYDTLGRQTQACPFDQRGCSSYVYDAGGLVRNQTDAKGQVVSYTYDILGRRSTLTSPTDGITQWFYDEAGHGPGRIGRVSRVTYAAGSESYEWNALGLETQIDRCIGGECLTIQKGYDGGRRLSTLQYPDGEVVTHGYHAEGYLTSLSSSLGGYVSSIARNTRGQITSLAYTNGTSTGYAYSNPYYMLSAITASRPGGTLFRASYGYNAASQLTTIGSTTHPAWNGITLGYDWLYRLTSVTGGSRPQTLTYDAIGNIATSSLATPTAYAYADPDLEHAVTQANGFAYDYDANGQLVSVAACTPGCAVPVRLLSWNAERRLASASANGQTSFYRYAPDGQRIEKKVGPKLTRYFGNLVEVTHDGDQTSVTKYYYADGNLVAQRTDATPTWIHQDHLDSVRALSDAAGAEVGTRDYAAFGEMLSSTGPASTARGYGAHWPDAESGLLYLGARSYDPVLSRFVEPDPVVPEPGDPQSWNRYSFVRNNPLNRVDPTGSIDLGALAGGTFVQHFGGNRAAGELFGSLGGSVAPGVGELADVGVVFSLDHKVGTGVRLLATASILVNVATAGFAPNVGAPVSKLDEGAEVLESIADVAGGICFAGGTLVETHEGLVAIEEIDVGDVVLSRDPETGETAWKPVTRVFATPDQAVLRVDLVGDDGRSESLSVTGEHPFWVSEMGWVPAQELQPGMPVLSSTGRHLQVESRIWQPTRETVYNFEVDEFHTYFVGAGGAWVHNKCQAGAAKPRALPELPILDATGKVHGDLPRVEDLGRYEVEDLGRLRDELAASVQKRIEMTTRKGSDFGHAERQASEQQLIKSIEKHLEDR